MGAGAILVIGGALVKGILKRSDRLAKGSGDFGQPFGPNEQQGHKEDDKQFLQAEVTHFFVNRSSVVGHVMRYGKR